MTSKELKDWQGEAVCRATVDNLCQRGFKAAYCASGKEALEYVLKEAETAGTIGCGGSMTMAELGVYAALEARGRTILNHNVADKSDEEKASIRRQQMVCDLFLTGTNALTAEGDLVNIDGVGNRVAAMIFGPKETIVAVGRNKIVQGGIDEAISRVKNVAAPPNGKRLGLDTPCALTGFCADCMLPQSMCRVLSVISLPPRLSDLRVLVINEDLGL